MKKYITLLAFFLVLTFIGCPSKELVKPAEPPTLDINSDEGLYAEGQYYLKYKDYEYALRSFYTLIEDFEEDTLADDAQFMIAEILSNPKNPNHDLETALEEYESLIDNYPDSPYVKKAEKKIAQIEKKLEKSE